LSQSVLPEAANKVGTKTGKSARKTSTQAAALKAQPDADKTLSTILSRLDDMKAEDSSPAIQ